MNRLSQSGELDLLINAEVIPMVGLTGNLWARMASRTEAARSLATSTSWDLIGASTSTTHSTSGLVACSSGPIARIKAVRGSLHPGIIQGFSKQTQRRSGPTKVRTVVTNGLQAWGQAAGGLFKYYAGVFQLHDAKAAPLFSSRLTLSLINPEPSFYGNSQYYGKKDVLGIGIGAQHEKDGRAPGTDYNEFNADILFEEKPLGCSVLDVEGAFYGYKGEPQRVKILVFALASFLIAAPVGPGRLQPLVRIQQAKPNDSAAKTWTIIDAQSATLVDDFACRFALGFQHQGRLGSGGKPTLLGRSAPEVTSNCVSSPSCSFGVTATEASEIN